MDRRGDDGRRVKRDGTVALEMEGGSHQSRNAGGPERLEKAGEILPPRSSRKECSHVNTIIISPVKPMFNFRSPEPER